MSLRRPLSRGLSVALVTLSALPALSTVGCTVESPGDEGALSFESLALELPGTVPSSVAVGAEGDLLLGGSFYGVADFGGGGLVAEPNGSLFVAHLDPNGQHLFSGSTGSQDTMQSVAIGPEGDLYVAGGFDGLANFGTGKFFGSQDAFLAAFGPAGDSRYGFPMKGKGSDWIDEVRGLPGARAVVVGRTSDTGDFGGGAPSLEYTKNQFVVAQYGADGDLLWETRTTCSLNNESALAVDAGGSAIFSGMCYEMFEIGGQTGGSGSFLVKLGPGGDPLWIVGVDAGQTPRFTDIATDADGNIYAAGFQYEGFTIAGVTVSEGPNQNAFLVKLSPDGKGLFARTFTITNWADELEIAATPDGGVVVGMRAYGTASFGGSFVGSVDNADVVLGKFTAGGELVSSMRLDGTDQEYLSDVAVDAAGDVIVTGTFNGLLDIPDAERIVGDTYGSGFVARFTM